MAVGVAPPGSTDPCVAQAMRSRHRQGRTALASSHLTLAHITEQLGTWHLGTGSSAGWAGGADVAGVVAFDVKVLNIRPPR